MWLNRVGFNQVSNDCRLIFFSRAPRIFTHGLSEVGVAGTKDIVFPSRDVCHSAIKELPVEAIAKKTMSLPGLCKVRGQGSLWCARSSDEGDYALTMRSLNAAGRAEKSLVNGADSSTFELP